jgi:uncharacterized protein (TIGR03118 family)
MPAAAPQATPALIQIEFLEDRLLMSKSQPIFTPTNLASDQAGQAAHTITQLKNAWGLVQTGGSFWVAANGSDVGLPLSSTGALGSATPITVPSPTGIILNNTTAFGVDDGSGSTKPATYLIASEDGGIYAWVAPAAGSGGSGTVKKVVDRSSSGAEYKGLAIATNFGQPLLYAANFTNGTVDVFDAQFNKIDLSPSTLRPAFTDTNLPAGFAPFNITPLGPNLLVTFALQGDNGDEQHGAGLGRVDLFTTQGQLLRRFSAKGHLNAPWGIVIAPSNFGKFSDDILIGNFGDGQINAFSTSGKYAGTLSDENGNPVVIDGLWGLSTRGNAVFFAAGPSDETHGLFGEIQKTGKRVPTATKK